MEVRAWLRSKPGMYEQYDGYVDVYVTSLDWDEIFDAACAKLKRIAFPDRNKSMWKMERYEQIGN